MDGQNWDPKPPYGVNQGYDRYPGYDRVSGYDGPPRQVPPPGYSRTAASPGYDFGTISNSPLYQQGYGYQPPLGMEADDEGAKGMGTASMVLGICSLGLTFLGLGFSIFCFISLIASIVGLSLGGVSLGRYKRTGATDGKGMAVAGVVMNSINLGLAVLGLLMALLMVGMIMSMGEWVA